MRPGWAKYLRTLGFASRNILAGEGIFPFYASFKITSRCGSRCPHCYVPREAPAPDLDTAAAKRVVANLAAASVLVLTLEGGEPFLREDLEDLLIFARRFPIFVSIVTSYPDIGMERHARLANLVDFLQLSLDEGHANAHLFGRLGEIASIWRTRICIQTVVTADSLGLMDEKARQASRHGCKILFLPVSPIYPDLAPRCPERSAFIGKVRMLKQMWPGAVITSLRFLRAYGAGRGCSSSSVVIDSDGGLYYPCHILKAKPFNLLDGRMGDFLLSREAHDLRRRMSACPINCGWYQYFAISLRSVADLPGDVASALERLDGKPAEVGN